MRIKGTNATGIKVEQGRDREYSEVRASGGLIRPRLLKI